MLMKGFGNMDMKDLQSDLPVIGIPLGDLAGIGPEIAVKAAASDKIRSISVPLLVGPANIIRQEAERAGIPVSALYIEDTGDFSTDYVYGKIQGSCGLSAYNSIKIAAGLASAGRIDALATTPINKEALRAAGISTIGHTELLAEFTGTKDSVTLFNTRSLKIFFLSRHLSLRDACNFITEENVYQGILRVYQSMKLLGMDDGALPFAIAGLNPHNGEHGLFGNEEEESIYPAVRRANSEGIPVTGPIPADSVFYMTRMGKYSAVLSLYHDQGHIAAKTYDFDRTISLTLGLPFLRTSVDHGTAFDIAGQGVAQFTSMQEAIIMAAETAKRYRTNYIKFNSSNNK
ncbi:MAG: 4-hydroxythreonine-4-phosphate dehydrogenase PdxA [Saccharofermentanales bacterium]